MASITKATGPWSECGKDCSPEPFVAEEGTRISLDYPEHELHVIVDPVDGQRQLRTRQQARAARWLCLILSWTLARVAGNQAAQTLAVMIRFRASKDSQ
ncbi:hypothetical protein [Tomitella fengzijianii]|uniref:hypothetical protein n=1 Tax=Tomitella fengzijianii TaxID=2597660 RepID=UPI00131E125B|nr:hypothetical protein [Tomitella fengzijianii]